MSDDWTVPVEILRCNVDTSNVHEVNHGLQVLRLHTFEVEEGVGVGGVAEQRAEHGGAGSQQQLVRFWGALKDIIIEPV